MSETYEAVQTISGRWEIRSHHDDCSEGIPLNESEIRRAVACLRSCAGIPTVSLEAGALAKALDALSALVARRRSACEDNPCSRFEGSDGRYARASDALRALGRLP